MGLRGVLGLVCTKLANPSAQYIRFEVEDLFGTAPMFRYAAGCDKIALISNKEMNRIVKPGGFIAHYIDRFNHDLNCAEFDVITRAGFLLPKNRISASGCRLPKEPRSFLKTGGPFFLVTWD